ncbi:MAG: hypothetical protein HQL95_01725 [Magnetococcales bacterium]|nr:hypothetical protein [Magnetococcales bacterium]
MPSTAIPAKGSTFSIGTTSGSANNITAVSLTNPCLITLSSSVAGLTVGDVVTIAGITGTTQLNGGTYVIQYIEPANKIITLAGVNALAYTAWTSGGTVTPQGMNNIKNLQSFSGPKVSKGTIEVTNLESTATEFIYDILNSGTFSFDFDHDRYDAGQLALEDAINTNTAKNFKLIIPDGTTYTFSGFVSSIDISGGKGQTVKRNCEIRINCSIIKS